MDKIKKMWCNLSLRKSIILYISAFVILAILLSAGTATLCNNATKTIESKYPPTGEKYYLTNENGERLGDGNYIGVAPVAMSEKDQRLLSICEVAPIIATPIYSALCIITATLLFYRNKLKKPLTELKAASEMISNNNLDFSIKYDSKDELGELCSSFETMRFTLANNFSEMWRQMEERKQLNAAFAHDLRTPLTVLKGYNEILQSNHDPITKSTAVTMGKHIFRLERYVDSMSHLRRLEDAQPISDKSNISGYVTAIADSARILCEQSGKTLSIQNNISDIPIGIDYTFVSQVNNNLISNAIKYSFDLSKIDLNVIKEESDIIFRLQDFGIGISKEDIDKIYNPFYRSNPSEHPRIKGTGLGLSIVNRLSDLLKFDIKISSENSGTLVVLKLRISQ